MKPTRHLVVVLGDQLDAHSAAFDGLDPKADAVWMAEVGEESTRVWTHKARIALFLASMRHFRDALRQRGVHLEYRQIEDRGNRQSLDAELVQTLRRLQPSKVIMVEPGEWRVEQSLRQVIRTAGVALEIRPDRRFFCSRQEFAVHARSRKQLRMEFFYRQMRRKHQVLMDDDRPTGGTWNFDAENRESFGRTGPPDLVPMRAFRPDALTREVLALVAKRFAEHPGNLANFDWPVTPGQARTALKDFVAHRLLDFGQYQDAMWSSPNGGSTPEEITTIKRDAFLYHSRLSAALNLKLLDPREAIAAAEAAHRDGHAPLASVEGFIRQILGWREYVRGIYWHFMPDYLELNALNATAPLPAFYWTGDTDLNCLHHAIRQTLEYGYAHHIQRLMVTGLFALLLGVQPQAVHEWYLAMYVDAVEWVELPNTLGMSQFSDGGLMASKPYVATGKYIRRMSNYCAGCRYDPTQSTGTNACPFTTLYWSFLIRHEKLLSGNQRMTMQFRNLNRLDRRRRSAIRRQAEEVSKRCLHT